MNHRPAGWHNSRNVAEHFEKQHGNLLQAIENLISTDLELSRLEQGYNVLAKNA